MIGSLRATGDLVRQENEKLFFAGRKDFQVKRLGKRIQVEAVSDICARFDGVERCWYVCCFRFLQVDWNLAFYLSTRGSS